MITETQKAYLAGIIDGEGCILITAPQAKKGGESWYGHYLTLTVANSHIPTLHWIKSVWGGTLVIRNQKHTRVPVGNLRWTSQQAINVIKDAMPYLRMKESQASIALLFVESIKPRGEVLSKAEWDDREELRLAISKLNCSYSELKKVPYPIERYKEICPICGNKFTRERKSKTYCSKECYEKAAYQRRKHVATEKSVSE